MWCLERNFSYIPDASFSVSTLFLPVMWCLVRSFSYIPDASFSESTLFLPVLVWGFSDTSDASQILMSFIYTLRVQWF